MNPTNPPTAEDLEDAHHLPWTVLDRAIAQFDRTRENAARAEALGSLDPRLDLWVELEVIAAIDARYQLTRAIIATNPEFAHHQIQNCERHRWPIRGVRSGGRIFLTFPDPNREGDPGGYDRPPLMMLVDFEAGAVLDSTVTSRFAEVVPGPIRPEPEVKPVAVEPVRPVWLLTVIKAAEDLGEAEALRRIFDVPRKPAS